MTTMIAIAGKGGVGKTTCTALILRALVSARIRPVLAVDADPNANLHLVMGLPQPPPLGSLREEVRPSQGGAVPAEDLLESLVQQRVAEGKDVDLITMGRGEGPGCYCFVNNLLRQSLNRLGGSYKAVVVDNEAGMEHLSRRNLRRIDHLVLVADPSPRGTAAARAIRDLSAELKLPVGRTWLLVNRPYAGWNGAPTPQDSIPLLAEVPHDPSLPEWEASGRPLIDAPASSPAAAAVERAVRRLLSGE